MFESISSNETCFCERSENVASEGRTHDLRIARPTRCQLRYCHCAIIRQSHHAPTACNLEVQERLVVFDVTWPLAGKIVPGIHLRYCGAVMGEKVPLPVTARRTNWILRDIKRCLAFNLGTGTLPRDQLKLVPRLTAWREARVAQPPSLPSLENSHGS